MKLSPNSARSMRAPNTAVDTRRLDTPAHSPDAASTLLFRISVAAADVFPLIRRASRITSLWAHHQFGCAGATPRCYLWSP